MKQCTVLVLFLGLIAGKMATAQTVCAGAEGGSTACAQGCSGTVVNDEVVAGSNTGKWNVGNGNQGDGNDGFNNVGDFNIGSGNTGNCNLNSGGTGGTCDVSNNNGAIVLRFCNVYPTDGKCQPSGYLPEFTGQLRSQIAAIVGSCPAGNVPPTPPSGAPPSGAPPSGAVPPAGATPPTTPGATAPGAGAGSGKLPAISDSKADFPTLLSLFAEHLKQEKAAGRKLML